MLFRPPLFRRIAAECLKTVKEDLIRQLKSAIEQRRQELNDADYCYETQRRDEARTHKENARNLSDLIASLKDELDDIVQEIQEAYENETSKWQETSCQRCHAPIKYNVEWNSVPRYCKSCYEERKSKWIFKACSKCGSLIKYNADRSSEPDLCHSCYETEKTKC